MTGIPNPAELMALERRLLRHYFRLQAAERRLFVRASRRHRGRSAVHQVERERQRLGRDLHTGVGQMLAAIRLQLELIEVELPDAPQPVRQALTRISTLAHDALELARSLSRRLYPPRWQRLTIEGALQELWDLSGIPQKFQASLRLEKLPRQPSLETKTLTYRAAQEAFSNLTRHARARKVWAALEARGDNLVLTVADDGVGFDAARQASEASGAGLGIGLRTIREQTEILNGKLVIESSDKGTKLELTAPFLPIGADL